MRVSSSDALQMVAGRVGQDRRIAGQARSRLRDLWVDLAMLVVRRSHQALNCGTARPIAEGVERRNWAYLPSKQQLQSASWLHAGIEGSY